MKEDYEKIGLILIIISLFIIFTIKPLKFIDGIAFFMFFWVGVYFFSFYEEPELKKLKRRKKKCLKKTTVIK